MTAEIKIFDRAEDLFINSAERIVSTAQEAIQKNGLFSLVLSGGSTPKGVYTILASAPLRGKIDWKKVHVFWGDERSVVSTHPDSNFRMAKEAFLDISGIPPANIHRIAGEEDPMLAAQQYEDDIKDFFKIADGVFPKFDLILLGVGEDGHTASLFPDSAAVTVNDRLVVDNYVRKLNTHRITFTFPLINQASNVLFLVSGSAKAKIVQHILENKDTKEIFPSQRVQTAHGSLSWFLDKDAGAYLK